MQFVDIKFIYLNSKINKIVHILHENIFKKCHQKTKFILMLDIAQKLTA